MSDTVFWSLGDEEELTFDEIDDVVEDFLDNFWEPDMTPQQFLDKIPEEIEVIGYKRMKPTVEQCDRALEDLLEFLDEEYGNPNGEATKPTEAMKAAEREFIEKVLAEYEVWACEPSGEKETINCRDWIKTNRPEWLKEDDHA